MSEIVLDGTQRDMISCVDIHTVEKTGPRGVFKHIFSHFKVGITVMPIILRVCGFLEGREFSIMKSGVISPLGARVGMEDGLEANTM